MKSSSSSLMLGGYDAYKKSRKRGRGIKPRTKTRTNTRTKTRRRSAKRSYKRK